MVEKKVFVLAGLGKSRDAKIQNIRKSYLKEKIFNNTIPFDAELCEEADFVPELYSLSFAPRLFIIDNAQDLSMNLKNTLGKYLKKNQKDYFIFLFPSLPKKESWQKDIFYRWLFRLAPPLNLSAPDYNSDFKRFYSALKHKNTVAAFISLAALFKAEAQRKETLALKLLGAVAKHFSFLPNTKHKTRIFRLIFEADRLLKQERINPQYVLEILLLKSLSLSRNSFR